MRKILPLLLGCTILSGCSGMIYGNSNRKYEQSRIDTARIYGAELIIPEELCKEAREKEKGEDNPYIYAQCLPMLYTEANVSNDQYIAKMKLRYKFADVQRAITECTADNTCKKVGGLEWKLLMGHNRAVAALIRQQAAKDNQQYASDLQQDRENWSDAWSTEPSVKCRSRQSGDVIQATCR